VDIARGIAIILVVYGHALRGSYWPALRPAAALQDAVIYSFHMPVFFVLGGIFLWPSLAKGRQACFLEKLRTILYPYFLWSFIAGGIELAASPFVNSPIGFSDLLKTPLVPIEQFWFLYALFIIQSTAIALYPRISAVLLVAICAPIINAFVDLPSALVQASQYFPYVAAGIVGRHVLERLGRSGRGSQLAVLLLCWSAFILLMIAELRFGFVGLLPMYLAGFVGTAGTIVAAMLLCSIAPFSALGALGRASMAIYVLHTIISAGTRIGLKLFDPSAPPGVVVALSTLTGLIFPYVCYLIARSYGIGLQLGFGRLDGGGSSGQPSSVTRR
jgi:fucose 4-O-acetylase-like acetyltransferase